MRRRRKYYNVRSNDTNVRKFSFDKVVEDEITDIDNVKPVICKNSEQSNLVQSIRNNDIVMVNGIAGSGKTHISCGLAAEYLLQERVEKIVITRPYVNAQEEFGFMPGNIKAKFLPFMVPMYTELGYFLNVEKEVKNGRLVIYPIAHLRGVTFKNVFLVADECQNITSHQMKLLLTRFGENSKFVLVGDSTQSDLVKNSDDFDFILDKLSYVATPENKISIVRMCRSVRHPIIDILLPALE